MNNHLGSVLLVDDDITQRTMLSLLLGEFEVDILEAGSGEEALGFLGDTLPSLVLLDFDMGGINGVETLKRIRQQYSQTELPVLMVSNRHDPDTIVEALDSGADDYIAKSTDPKILLARIRRHLIQKRLPIVTERPFGGKIGSYLLGDILSENSVSTLFEATDTRTNEKRALKVLRPGIRVDVQCYESLKSCKHDFWLVFWILVESRSIIWFLRLWRGDHLKSSRKR